MYINTDEFAISSKYINYKHSTILGSPVARIGERVNYLEELNINMPDVYNSLPTLKLEATNPFKTYTQIKNNTNILINTVEYRSTDKEEQFVVKHVNTPSPEQLMIRKAWINQ